MFEWRNFKTWFPSRLQKTIKHSVARTDISNAVNLHSLNPTGKRPTKIFISHCTLAKKKLQVTCFPWTNFTHKVRHPICLFTLVQKWSCKSKQTIWFRYCKLVSCQIRTSMTHELQKITTTCIRQVVRFNVPVVVYFKVVLSRDVTQFSLVDTRRRFIRNLFSPTGGRRFTWNVVVCLPDYKPSNIRKP